MFFERSICDMKVSEVGYTVPWATDWPSTMAHVAGGLNLTYGVFPRPTGTASVRVLHVKKGWFKVGWKVYHATERQLQAARKESRKLRVRHQNWLRNRKETKKMDCSKTCANFKKKETPYTEEAARKEVGSSTDYLAGLKASIKKWEQIVAGNHYSYTRESPCGLCFVRANRGNKEPFPCTGCPALPICKRIDANANTVAVLRSLRKLKEDLTTPFPDKLRTKDLKVGMLVRRNYGSRYVILEPPTSDHIGDKVKVLSFGTGKNTWNNYAREKYIYLADHGLQPYPSGKWNPTNWLEEL